MIAASTTAMSAPPAQLSTQPGKHKGGIKRCLYINKLADVQIDSLKEIIKKSLVEPGKTWPATAS
jgi:hypothetical protein